MLKKLVFVLTVAVAMMLGNTASAITVDGTFGLTEWNGYYANDDGVGNNGYVGPGYGGQSFDVEYLGLYIDANGTVYFGLQTGFNLASGVNYGGTHYSPGDFALDVNNDGVYDYAIRFTITSGVPSFTLEKVSTWQKGMYSTKYPQFAVSDPYRYATGTAVSTVFTGAYGSGVFSNNKDGGTSYVLEGSFDLSSLALYSGGAITLHWTMSCGNDYLNVTATPPPTPVPEPSTMLLIGSGLISWGAWGVVKRRKKA